MPTRTTATLNPHTTEKETLKKKFTTIKFRKPTELIVDVLTQEEKDR